MQASQRTAQTNQADSKKMGQQEWPNRTRHVLTITNGDSFLGRCIAAYLLKESERDGRGRYHECRIRVLCRNESDCDDLKDLGAEIFVWLNIVLHFILFYLSILLTDYVRTFARKPTTKIRRNSGKPFATANTPSSFPR